MLSRQEAWTSLQRRSNESDQAFSMIHTVICTVLGYWWMHEMSMIYKMIRYSVLMVSCWTLSGALCTCSSNAHRPCTQTISWSVCMRCPQTGPPTRCVGPGSLFNTSRFQASWAMKSQMFLNVFLSLCDKNQLHLNGTKPSRAELPFGPEVSAPHQSVAIYCCEPPHYFTRLSWKERFLH